MTALGDMHVAIQTWLLARVRTDYLTLAEVPTIASPPVCTMKAYPPERIQYERVTGGIHCTAEFPFELSYRFDKDIAYHNLPRRFLFNVLNNSLYYALETPAAIDKDIIGIRSGDESASIKIARSALSLASSDEADNDWLVQMLFNLNVRFRASIGDTGDINPPVPDGDFTLRELDIYLYRDKAGSDHQIRTLDRIIEITYEES